MRAAFLNSNSIVIIVVISESMFFPETVFIKYNHIHIHYGDSLSLFTFIRNQNLEELFPNVSIESE